MDPYDFVGNTPMGKTAFWSFTGLAWENFPTTALPNTETAPEPLLRDSRTSGTELLMTKTGKGGTVTAEIPHPRLSGKSVVSELPAYSEQGRKASKLS